MSTVVTLKMHMDDDDPLEAANKFQRKYLKIPAPTLEVETLPDGRVFTVDLSQKKDRQILDVSPEWPDYEEIAHE